MYIYHGLSFSKPTCELISFVRVKEREIVGILIVLLKWPNIGWWNIWELQGQHTCYFGPAILLGPEITWRQLGLEFFVVQENTKTITNTQQVSVMLGQLIDGFNLFIQEMFLQIIWKVRIIVSTGNLMQVQQWLETKIKFINISVYKLKCNWSI